MRFANPEAFVLLLLIPLYLIWYWRQRQQQAGLPFPALSLFAGLRRSWPWLSMLVAACYLASLICLTTALARPQMGKEFHQTTQKGIDIMLVLDVSVSMLAEDFSPNRLVAAQRVLDSFVARQQGNRVGVVVFSGQSFTLIPLTTDYGLVQESIKSIFLGMVKNPGTAIGSAIMNAIYRLDKQKTPSRVIVLLTDGEDNAQFSTPPLAAAQVARQKDIRIHTIGLGGSKPVPIPYTNPQTGRREYVTDGNGNPVLTSLSEAELRKIASMTGGLYFRADNDATLSSIYEQINQMEKSEFESRKQMIYSEQMHWFLVPGLLLLLLALGLGWGKGQLLEAQAS